MNRRRDCWWRWGTEFIVSRPCGRYLLFGNRLVGRISFQHGKNPSWCAGIAGWLFNPELLPAQSDVLLIWETINDVSGYCYGSRWNWWSRFRPVVPLRICPFYVLYIIQLRRDLRTEKSENRLESLSPIKKEAFKTYLLSIWRQGLICLLGTAFFDVTFAPARWKISSSTTLPPTIKSRKPPCQPEANQKINHN